EMIEQEMAWRAKEIAEVNRQIGADKEARSGLLSRVSVLEDMERRREGLDHAARWVLEQSRGGSESVVGLVGDGIRIDDQRVACLQAVLSRFENDVLVRDSYAFLAELARQTVSPGAISAIALDRLPSGPGPARYSDAPGFIAVALDWVQCDPEYRHLAETLLG